jgi:hypothetical protein
LNQTVQFFPNFTSPTTVALGANQQFSPISGATPFTSRIQAIVPFIYASIVKSMEN